MTPRTRIAIALIASTLVSGCLELSADPSEIELRLPPLGLGLQISETFPPPGPFVEGKDMETLKDFLTGEGQSILAECQSPSPQAPVILEYVVEENYAYAIEDQIWGCTSGSIPQLGHETMSERMKAETYQALMEHGESRYWAAYQNGTFRNHITLINAYNTLIGPTDRSWATIQILERCPWSAPPCETPDIESLAERTRENLDAAFAAARSYGHDARRDTGGFQNRFYDALY
jgi:hypothetical protein